MPPWDGLPRFPLATPYTQLHDLCSAVGVTVELHVGKRVDRGALGSYRHLNALRIVGSATGWWERIENDALDLAAIKMLARIDGYGGRTP